MAWSQKENWREAQIVLWKDLNSENSEMLKNAKTMKNVKDILIEIFNLCNYSELHKEKILLNLYTHTVQFAREQNFTLEQLSAYFSIVKRVHETCVESPFGNVEETFTYLKDLLICHSVCRPPYGIELFTIKEVRIIAHHMVNTYFRHYKLYKYIFTPQVKLDLVLDYIGDPESIINQEIDSEKEKKEKSEDLPIVDESIDKEEDLARINEKEGAKKYLRKLITDFLQKKIDELKLTVTEKLQESKQMLDDKLGNAGFNDTFKKKASRKFSKYEKKLSNH